MKKFELLFMLYMLLVAISACKQDVHVPIPNDGTTPKPISNPIVQNLAGGALISYTLPDDANLLYVRAEFDYKGVKMDVKSSFFKKTIVLEGFADTLIHSVNLYAVSRGEKASTPVTVQIKPLAAPIQNVFRTLSVKEGFGGFAVKFVNPSLGNVMIGVLQFDPILKEWSQIDAYYTNLALAEFSTRGLDSTQQLFGFFAKDRWNNKTDTLKLILKPIYEVKLDGTKFVDMRTKLPIPQNTPLPVSGLGLKDMVDYSSSYPVKNLFDGNISTMFHTRQAYDQPSWLPVDLGKTYRLSRYKLWQRTSTFLFNHGNPHEWEMWGTNTPLIASSWVKLTHEIMIKPSGFPAGTNSNDDVNAGNLGQEYLFPVDVSPVRYIGWKNLDSWGSVEGAFGFFHLMELTFWGQVVQ